MKRRLTIFALTTLAVVALISVVLTVTTPAHAGGAEQIRGTAVDGTTLCDPVADDVPPPPEVFPLYFPEEEEGGYLNGCLYSYILSSKSSPSGTYRERGEEIFVGDYVDEDGNVVSGMFKTTYQFTAKFDEDEKEIWGRCEHPLTGIGEGGFVGVTGRFDIKDDVAAGNFPYKGHVRW